MIKEMKKDGILVEIDGEREIDVIFEDIVQKLSS